MLPSMTSPLSAMTPTLEIKAPNLTEQGSGQPAENNDGDTGDRAKEAKAELSKQKREKRKQDDEIAFAANPSLRALAWAENVLKDINTARSITLKLRSDRHSQTVIADLEKLVVRLEGKHNTLQGLAMTFDKDSFTKVCEETQAITHETRPRPAS